MTADNDKRPDLLARLGKLNPTVVFLGAVVLFLLVLFAPDAVGAVLILIIAGALVALLTRTWPVLPPKARALRVLIIGLLVLVALIKLFA